MKIELALVINTLRSYNAPSEVIDHFRRMEASTPLMSAEERVGKQLESLRATLQDLATKDSAGLVRRAELQRRLLPTAPFRNDARRGNEALTSAIAQLIELGEISQLDASEAFEALKTNAVVYHVKQSDD